jgi:hypothetical protein
VLLEAGGGAAVRFREVRLELLVSRTAGRGPKAEQFAALSVPETGDGVRLSLAFRGTDDTIAGWKEDFLHRLRAPR